MTPAEFRQARKTLDLTVRQLANVLDLSMDMINKMQAGSRDIPKDRALAISLLLDPYHRPQDWPD